METQDVLVNAQRLAMATRKGGHGNHCIARQGLPGAGIRSQRQTIIFIEFVFYISNFKIQEGLVK
jgi:hypothetical protein